MLIVSKNKSIIADITGEHLCINRLGANYYICISRANSDDFVALGEYKTYEDARIVLMHVAEQAQTGVSVIYLE